MKTYPALISALFFLILLNVSLVAQDSDSSMPVFGVCYAKTKAEKTLCSNQNLINFISENLSYPEIAKTEFIEGTVVLGFTIDESGQLVDKKIIHDIGGGCGEEGIRLLELMTEWQPGMKADQPVPVDLTLPIRFALDDEKPRADNSFRLLWGTLSNREQVTAEVLKVNLLSEIFVLDDKGNKIPMNELLFSITKRKKYQDASSTGEITSEMIKLAGKVKPGVIFAVTATIQVKGGFEFVEREFEIIKE